MRFRKKRSILIKKKHIRIVVPILAIILLVVIIIAITSSNKLNFERQQAIENITDVGVINVGLRGDLGALCSFNEDTQEFEGLEKDIADEIIHRLFGDNILVNYILVSSETKDALMRIGDLDMAFGASLEKEMSGVCFTSSYYADASAFLVMEGQMTSQDELEGRTIAVVQGSLLTSESGKDKDNTEIEAYFAAHGINAGIKQYASYPEAVDALRTGFVGGVCANEIFLKLFGKKGMLILPERFIPHRYCIETRASLGLFCDVLSDTIKEMKKDGTMKALINKWNLIDYSALEE